MAEILATVLPVFGLIALGYGLALSGLLRPQVGEALAEFVFLVAIPVLIFRTIVEADLTGAEPWRIWLPFFAVFAIVWFLGDRTIRSGFGRDARAGLVAGVSAAYGNTVLLGIPLALAAFGEAGAVPMALLIAVHLPVMMTASAALIERAERQDGVATGGDDFRGKARTVFLNLAKSPIIIGIVTGGLWRILGLPLYGVPATLVDRIADVAATLALFAMGMSLSRYGLRGNIRAALVLSALKLIAMPGLVYLATRYVVPMPEVWAKVAVIAAACPTGVNAYVVAARFRTGEALSSNAITISTALSLLSVTLWLVILETTW